LAETSASFFEARFGCRHNRLRERIGFPFKRIRWVPDGQRVSAIDHPIRLCGAGITIFRAKVSLPLQDSLAPTLLHDMGELMRQDALSRVRPGLILSRSKHDVRSHRVRQRVHGLCRRGRLSIRVNLHTAEIVPEAWFHERACRFIEPRPGRTQNVVDNRRRADWTGLFGGASLQGHFLFLAFVALLTAARMLAAAALALHSERCWTYCCAQFFRG
jgi:hypothetical protein